MTSVLDAARNNAAWCDAVCRRAGLPVATDGRRWWTTARSPDGYPDAVTLQPGAQAEEILEQVDTSTGCSVKDSFADIDLAPRGFHVLFDATWIHRPPGEPARALGLDWHSVETPSHFADWAAGHAEASAIGLDLVGPDLQLLAAHRRGRLVAGAALSRADAALGVSNLFVLDGDRVEVWNDVVTVASRMFPGLPLVGYEYGDELEVAASAGFGRLGPLRVWML